MSALLFLHVLGSMLLLGAAVTAAASALAARRGGDEGRALLTVSAWAAVLTVVATLLVIALGEALAAEQDLTATWLDVARALAVLGLLGGGLAAAILARLASERPRLAAAAGTLALGVSAVALAVTFLMAAKPS